MANPWKHPKTGVHYLRVRVPKDLQKHVGSELIKRSLRTKDVNEAKRLHSEAATELLQRWNMFRKGVQSLTDRQATAIAGELYRSALEVGPYRNFMQGMYTAVRLQEIEIALGEMDQLPRKDLYQRVGTREQALERIIGPLVSDYLSEKGLLLDESSHDRVLMAVGYAIRQAAYQTLRECEGNWQPDPDANRFPALELPTTKEEQTKAEELPFEEAWKVASVGYATATCKRWRPILESLIESAKKSNIRTITEYDVEAWVDGVLAAGDVSRRSFVRNNLTAVKTFFGKLKAKKKIAVNPTVDVKIHLSKGDKGRDMRGFRNEEAFKILEASFAEAPAKLSKHYAHARRWVPWLCAYTGARVNEITQARACDIRSLEGYWCILITPEAGTQKTCSKRDVPIHKDLIDQGFLDFVRTKKGNEPLFALRSTPGKTAPSHPCVDRSGSALAVSQNL
jgi:integrase